MGGIILLQPRSCCKPLRRLVLIVRRFVLYSIADGALWPRRGLFYFLTRKEQDGILRLWEIETK